MMKPVYLVLVLILGMAAPAMAEVQVNLTAVLNKDFSERPSLDQAVQALETDMPFGGFGWEVVIGHAGLGGNYLVDFIADEASSWWLDWNAHALYTSLHFFGPSSFIDPFVQAGIGCSGQVYLGPSGEPGSGIAISLYPYVAAGAAVNFDHLRLGADMSYAPWSSPIPVTGIPEFSLGAFQVTCFVGVGL